MRLQPSRKSRSSSEGASRSNQEEQRLPPPSCTRPLPHNHTSPFPSRLPTSPPQSTGCSSPQVTHPCWSQPALPYVGEQSPVIASQAWKTPHFLRTTCLLTPQSSHGPGEGTALVNSSSSLTRPYRCGIKFHLAASQ